MFIWLHPGEQLTLAAPPTIKQVEDDIRVELHTTSGQCWSGWCIRITYISSTGLIQAQCNPYVLLNSPTQI